MQISWASLTDFRNYTAAELALAPEGVTLLEGSNGAGKTNLLEALAYSSMLRSFRGAPVAALVRSGLDTAVVRVEAQREARSLLVEVELHITGRDKLRLNRQPVRRSEDVSGAVLVTVFSPADIELVKGPPQARRELLDDLAGALYPKHRSACSELERVLKQRNALLKSAGGQLRPGMANTLDVWDAKMATVGESVAAQREALTEALQPHVTWAYERLSSQEKAVVLSYERSWQGDLREALSAARAEDLRRGLTSLGPQRDELAMRAGGLTARVQASQGEQRSLALALRLGGHYLLTEAHGTTPVLMLDDIFSELDERRSNALAACLPSGQALLTTATIVPPDLPVVERVKVEGGTLAQAVGERSGAKWPPPAPGEPDGR